MKKKIIESRNNYFKKICKSKPGINFMDPYYLV